MFAFMAWRSRGASSRRAYGGSGSDAIPMTAFRAVTARTPGWLAVTHARGREKALKPFGWMDRRAERIMDARPEVLRRGVQADRARLGRREDGVAPDLDGP